MTPTILAQKAKEAVKGLTVKVSVLGEKQMESIGMRAILSVGRGSDEESKFIVMEYFGDKKVGRKSYNQNLKSIYTKSGYSTTIQKSFNIPWH